MPQAALPKFILPKSSLPMRSMPKSSGAVLLTVVLVAAFVVLVLTQASKQVLYQKQLNSNLINKDQAYEYLKGMEELAVIWLQRAFEKEDEKDQVNLSQPWAQEPITFPIDGGAMTASIVDRQSCFNLNSLVFVDPNDNREDNNQPPSERNSQDQRNGGGLVEVSNRPQNLNSGTQTIGEQIFERLIQQVAGDLTTEPQALAAAARDWIDNDIEPAGPDGAEDDYYLSLEFPYTTANTLMADVSELRAVKGFTAPIYEKLKPYLCVLPTEKVATINVNTIDADHSALLWATLGGKVSMGDVNRLISDRPEKGYNNDEFWSQIDNSSAIKQAFRNRVGVNSHYFMMKAQAKLGNTRVYMRSLLYRDDANFSVLSRYYGKE